jgi:hypothetical protein
VCKANACGGDCGACDTGEKCSGGTCVACGANECGGTCGDTCQEGLEHCENGICVLDPPPES